MNKQKINEQVFKVRLIHNLKKSSYRELELTAQCVAQEIQRRAKKGKSKKC